MKSIKSKINIILVGVIFLSMILTPSLSGVQAIEYGLLGGRPANPDPSVENSSAWFIYNLEAGESKEDSIEVMNLFDNPMDIMVYAADGIHSSSGGFALRQYTEPKEEVGSWVKFYPTNPPEYFGKVFEKLDSSIIEFCKLSKEEMNTKLIEIGDLDEEEEISSENVDKFNEWCKGKESMDITLDSKQHLFIPFVFSVPEGTDIGEHTGGILIQKVSAEDTTTQEGSAVKLTTRVGVRIYQTVPGDIIKNLSLESFDVTKNFKEFDLSRLFFMKWFGKGNEKPEDYLVTSKVSNSGNVSAGFEETITIKDIIFGKRSEEVTRNYQVLKNDFFISNYSWENPRFGYFEFSKAIKYDDQNGNQKNIQTDSIRTFILPIREIVFTLAIMFIAASVYVGRKVYLKRKYNIGNWNKYKVVDGDDINNLADTYNIDWRILAKVNKIKAPFKLSIGDDILVPSNEEDIENNSNADDDSDDEIGSDKALQEDNSEIVSGSSIAEALWEDYDKKEVTKDIEDTKKGNKMDDIKEIKEDKEELGVPLISDEKNEIKKESSDTKGSDDKDDKEIMDEYLSKKKTKKLWIYASLTLIAFVVVVYMAFSVGKSTAEKEKVVVEKEVPVAQKIPIVEQESVEKSSEENEKESPKEEAREADFSNTNVLVLNGGTVAGAAGKMKDVILNATESMKDVEADNAVGEYTEKTIIYYQEDFKIEAEKIAEIIEEDYGKIKVLSMSEFPEGETEENVVIIIGEK